MALEKIESGFGIEEVATDVQALAVALGRATRLVALTGAGISTESGIPDYRSPNGAWARHSPIYYADFVRSPAVRRRYWARSLNGYGRFRNAQPNAGHYALADLEHAGLLHALVTQNVDRLHTLAGSLNVIELHGENGNVQCIECGYREPRIQTQARLEWDNKHLRLPADEVGDGEGVVIPLCPECGGLVKPAVVFFGEPVPPEVTAKALKAVEEADALLVVGSSLTVWSGYRLARAARQGGKPLYILNIGPTRADAEATMKLEAPAGATLARITEQLMRER
ncbi:MAG: NAD-dependent protein deacetylase [Chloroflexi bacterium]|nr:NAD-dependent protein deacetylase [Chloroflexota bacterium]